MLPLMAIAVFIVTVNFTVSYNLKLVTKWNEIKPFWFLWQVADLEGEAVRCYWTDECNRRCGRHEYVAAESERRRGGRNCALEGGSNKYVGY